MNSAAKRHSTTKEALTDIIHVFPPSFVLTFVNNSPPHFERSKFFLYVYEDIFCNRSDFNAELTRKLFLKTEDSSSATNIQGEHKNKFQHAPTALL
jgi:hypothetical protein